MNYKSLTTVGILAVILGASIAQKFTIQAKVNRCCSSDQYWNGTLGQCLQYQNSPENLNSTNWTVHEEFAHQGAVIQLEWQQHSFRPFCPFNNSETKYLRRNGSGEEIENSFAFTHHGVLLEIPGNNSNTSHTTLNYQVEHYCMDPTPEGIVIQICPPICGEHEPCLRKCCPLGQHLSLRNHKNPKCVPSNQSTTSHDRWHLPLHTKSNESDKHFPPATHLAFPPRFSSGLLLNCSVNNTFQTSSGWKSVKIRDPFKVLTDGSFASRLSGQKDWINLRDLKYCYDRAEGPDEDVACEGEPEILYYCGESDEGGDENEDYREEEEEFATDDNQKSSFQKLWEIVANIMLWIATIILGLTVIILFLILQPGNIHDWTRLSFVTSEWALLIMCMIARFSNVGDHSPKSCVAIAIIFHYTGLVTVSWISVLNFDLWWTFKFLQTSVSKTKKLRQFACYTAFALGLPLVILIISIGMESKKPIDKVCRREAAVDSVIYPRYGENGLCSLDNKSLGAYWYGPLCVLLFLNLVFFLSTTARLINLRKATRRASVVSTRGTRVSLAVFVKIFIMAGITWNIELIGWIWSKYRLDILHYIQAVGLFIIFVVQRAALTKLQKKYPILKKIIPLPSESDSKKASMFSDRKNSSIVVPRKYSNEKGEAIKVCFQKKPVTEGYPTNSIEFISIASSSNE